MIWVVLSRCETHRCFARSEFYAVKPQRQEPKRVGYLFFSCTRREQRPGSPRGAGTDEAQGRREQEGAGGA